MKKVLILIGHGDIPLDFPKEKFKEYLRLRSLYKVGSLNEEEKNKFFEIEENLKNWERNEVNDTHYFELKKFSEALEKELNIKVTFAFNEFCAPSIEEKFESIKNEYEEIYFLPTIIFGGHHTQIEIKNKIEKLKKENPYKKIFYIYPFKVSFIKDFFIKVIKEFINK